MLGARASLPALPAIRVAFICTDAIKLKQCLEGAARLSVAPSVVVSRVDCARERLARAEVYSSDFFLVPLRVRPDLRSLVRV
jgi:hypothetical protein